MSGTRTTRCKIPMDYHLAMAAGQDAMNASARRAGRPVNEDDWNVGAALVNRLLENVPISEGGLRA